MKFGHYAAVYVVLIGTQTKILAGTNWYSFFFGLCPVRINIENFLSGTHLRIRMWLHGMKGVTSKNKITVFTPP